MQKSSYSLMTNILNKKRNNKFCLSIIKFLSFKLTQLKIDLKQFKEKQGMKMRDNFT